MGRRVVGWLLDPISVGLAPGGGGFPRQFPALSAPLESPPSHLIPPRPETHPVQMLTREGEHHLYLKKRKGFVKVRQAIPVSRQKHATPNNRPADGGRA